MEDAGFMISELHQQSVKHEISNLNLGFLPLAAIIDDQIFCVQHKGKFKSIVTYLLLCSICQSICSASGV